IVFTDNDKETPIAASELLKTLRPKLEQAAARGTEKVIFVDFDDSVPWANVVGTMDSIRSLAADVNHDEVKVALKVKEEPGAAPKQVRRATGAGACVLTPAT